MPTKLFRVDDRPGFHDRGIPWEMIAAHEKQAERNHQQTLRRLHERGGLAWSEALAILRDEPWKNEPNAKALVLTAVAAWEKSRDAQRRSEDVQDAR